MCIPEGDLLRRLNSAFGGSRVLVTGGAGMVGSVMVRALVAAGAEVVVYDNLAAYPFDYAERFGVRDDRISLVVGDLEDKRKLRAAATGADLIVHGAAYADVAGCVTNHGEDFRTNVLGTQNALDVALDVRPRRLLFISSASLYGNPSHPDARFSEGGPTWPLSTYANSKLWGEHQTRLFHELYGLSATSVRLFSVYGPPQIPKLGSQSWCVAVFAMQALAGVPITVYGDGMQVRDFTYVGDVVAGLLLAAAADETIGMTLNLGTGTPTRVLAVADLIRRSVADVPIDFLPRPLGDPVGAAADTGRLFDLLGWRPAISLEDGVSAYLWWLRANRDLIPEWLVERSALRAGAVA